MTFKRRAREHKLIFGLLLIVLVQRAFVPTGYMPANGHPLSLAICHDGMHSHSNGHTSTEHCPFGGAPGTAPTPNIAVTTAVARSVTTGVVFQDSPPVGVRFVYIPQPRGPPRIV